MPSSPQDDTDIVMNPTIEDCQNTNDVKDAIITVATLSGTMVAEESLLAAESFLAAEAMTLVGAAGMLPVAVGIAAGGIAIGYAASQLTEQDCEIIAQHMNDTAARQSAGDDLTEQR